jgi:hypothetical protein
MNEPFNYPMAPLPRHRLLTFLGGCVGIYALASFLFLPLSIFFGSDVVFQGTLLYEIFTLLCVAAELVAFCWVFSHIISARVLYGLRAAVRIIALFAAADAFRYVAAFLVSWRMEGLDPDDLLAEFAFMAVYILLDLTLSAFVLGVTHLLLNREDTKYAIRSKALLSRGDTPTDRISELIPTSSIVGLRGPLNVATLVGGGLILLVRLGGRVIYDIGYGAPADVVDLAWMIFYYLSDIAVSVLCCSLIRFLTVNLCKKYKK